MVRALRAGLGLAEGDEIDPELLAQNIEFGKWMLAPVTGMRALRFRRPRLSARGRGPVLRDRPGADPAPWLPMNAFIARLVLRHGGHALPAAARVDVRAIYLRERVAAGWGPA